MSQIRKDFEKVISTSFKMGEDQEALLRFENGRYVSDTMQAAYLGFEMAIRSRDTSWALLELQNIQLNAALDLSLATIRGFKLSDSSKAQDSKIHQNISTIEVLRKEASKLSTQHLDEHFMKNLDVVGYISPSNIIVRKEWKQGYDKENVFSEAIYRRRTP